MGSSGSKAARTAAGAAGRKYPSTAPAAATRAPPTNAPAQPPSAGQVGQPGPTVRPQARASTTRDEAIDLDARDPDFARSLRAMGVVQTPGVSHTSTYNDARPGYEQSAPDSQYSPSATQAGAAVFPDPANSPAVQVLRAREKIQAEADREFIEAGRKGHPGRQFLDVVSLRQVLMLRDEKGVDPTEIERQLKLRKGVVERLGKKGVVGLT